MGLEKVSVSTAAIHECGGEFAAEFSLGFRNDTGKPFDATHGGGLGGHFFGIEHGLRGLALLVEEEIAAADELDAESEIEAGLTVVVVVLGVVVEVLAGYAVSGEEGSLGGGEIGLGTALAFGVERDGFVIESPEVLLKFVVFHGDATYLERMKSGKANQAVETGKATGLVSLDVERRATVDPLDWYHETEFAAALGEVLGRDRAEVGFDDTAADGETQAGAFFAGC